MQKSIAIFWVKSLKDVNDDNCEQVHFVRVVSVYLWSAFFFFISVYGCSNVFLPILNEMCGYLVGFGVKKIKKMRKDLYLKMQIYGKYFM